MGFLEENSLSSYSGGGVDPELVRLAKESPLMLLKTWPLSLVIKILFGLVRDEEGLLTEEEEEVELEAELKELPGLL